MRRAFPEMERLSPAFVILAATASVPVVRGLIQGQDAILLLFVLTMSLVSLEEKRDVVAGAALAAGLFKFHIVVPLTLVLAVRRPRLLLGFFPIAAVLGIISAMMVGWRGVIDYPRFLLGLEKSGAIGAIAVMPNLRGLMVEILGGDGSRPVLLWTIILSIVALVWSVWQVRGREHSIRFVFAIASVTGILVSYHAITHDLTLLLPIVLLLLAAPVYGSGARYRDTILLMVVYTIFLISGPWPWLSPFWCVPVVIWIFRKFGSSQADVFA